MTCLLLTMPRKSHLACFLILTLCSPALHAEPKPVEIKWSELSALVTGHAIEFTTKEGVSLKGDVVAVRPEELVLNVKRSSNPKLTPTGGAAIARASLDSFRLVRTRGKWGRSVGTTLGVVSGLTLGGYAAAQTADSAAVGIATFLVITGAVTVAGHYLGRAADRKTTSFQIVP